MLLQVMVAALGPLGARLTHVTSSSVETRLTSSAVAYGGRDTQALDTPAFHIKGELRFLSFKLIQRKLDSFV